MSHPRPVAVFQRESHNAKLSPVDFVDVGLPRKRPVARAPFCCSTYATIQGSCPRSCPLKRRGDRAGGCYADVGWTRFTVKRLDDNALARGVSPFEVILEESEAIDLAFPHGVPQDGPGGGGRPLRLHVAGDVPTNACAGVLAGTTARWYRRGGGCVWGYTHAWPTVDRESWGAISVLASVETPALAEAARARGYAPAIIVDRFPSERVFSVDGHPFIPCPEQTRGVTCVDCGLCFDDRKLKARSMGIAFQLHGQDVAEALVAIGKAPRLPGIIVDDEQGEPEGLDTRGGARGESDQRRSGDGEVRAVQLPDHPGGGGGAPGRVG